MNSDIPRPPKRGPCADLVDECKAAARDGAAKVHAAAATPTPKIQRTDAESAALARARLDKETR